MFWAFLIACRPVEIEKTPISPVGLASFYRMLEEDALSFEYNDGAWTEDYGDAAAFGPYFYSSAGLEEDNAQYIQIAVESSDYNLNVVNQSSSDLGWMLQNI